MHTTTATKKNSWKISPMESLLLFIHTWLRLGYLRSTHYLAYAISMLVCVPFFQPGTNAGDDRVVVNDSPPNQQLVPNIVGVRMQFKMVLCSTTTNSQGSSVVSTTPSVVSLLTAVRSIPFVYFFFFNTHAESFWCECHNLLLRIDDCEHHNFDANWRAKVLLPNARSTDQAST